MSEDKHFSVPPPKSCKTKRPSTVGAATTSRTRVGSSKERITPNRTKVNKNSTIADLDASICKLESSMPNFDTENRQIAYGKFLRAMLEECLVDEKIEREETEMDHQMLQLAERFQKTVDVLDKTNRRLKDVSFVVEQKRLLDLKNQDSNRFYETTESSNAQELLENLAAAEKACLNQLETRNVDFGYDKDCGHKQLLDAVNEALSGLDEIKKHSNLDVSKFKEYENSAKTLNELEKDKMDLDSLKADFEKTFPKFSEKLLKEMAEKIAGVFENDNDD